MRRRVAIAVLLLTLQISVSAFAAESGDYLAERKVIREHGVFYAVRLEPDGWSDDRVPPHRTTFARSVLVLQSNKPFPQPLNENEAGLLTPIYPKMERTFLGWSIGGDALFDVSFSGDRPGISANPGLLSVNRYSFHELALWNVPPTSMTKTRGGRRGVTFIELDWDPWPLFDVIGLFYMESLDVHAFSAKEAVFHALLFETMDIWRWDSGKWTIVSRFKIPFVQESTKEFAVSITSSATTYLAPSNRLYVSRELRASDYAEGDREATSKLESWLHPSPSGMISGPRPYEPRLLIHPEFEALSFPENSGPVEIFLIDKDADRTVAASSTHAIVIDEQTRQVEFVPPLWTPERNLTTIDKAELLVSRLDSSSAAGP